MDAFLPFGCLVTLFVETHHTFGEIEGCTMLEEIYNTKPYNICLKCPYQEKGCEHCDGPRTSSMPIGRWREFMRDMKEVKHLTYEQLAERAKHMMSAKHIQNAISENAKGDINLETSRIIENAILGSASRYPCYLAFEQSVQPDAKKLQEAEIQLINLQANLKMLNETFKQEIEAVRKEAQEKIDYLRRESEKKDAIISKLLER